MGFKNKLENSRKDGIIFATMTKINNGGAIAIKGFNYQKSIIVLIAVLNYLNDDFQIYVESEDDIVVTLKGQKTYIQAKSSPLNITSIMKRPKNKDSILEKNLSCGESDDGIYKLVTPDFGNKDKYLARVEPSIITKGVTIYAYSDDGFKEVEKRLPKLSKVRLNSSRVALTAFRANYDDALMQIMGIMASEGISVDNNHGKASLQELCNEIDERSEFVAENENDYEKKKFTHENLSTIFSHSYKMNFFEDITKKLGFPIAKTIDLKNKRMNIRAIYGSYHNDSMKFIKQLDICSMNEAEVISKTLEAISFNDSMEEIEKQAIVIDAFSQILFERAQLCK